MIEVIWLKDVWSPPIRDRVMMGETSIIADLGTHLALVFSDAGLARCRVVGVGRLAQVTKVRLAEHLGCSIDGLGHQH